MYVLMNSISTKHLVNLSTMHVKAQLDRLFAQLNQPVILQNQLCNHSR